MPELPEVETIARTLAPEVAGRRIEAVECLDPSALRPGPEAFAALAVGREILSVGRRGKLLLLRLGFRPGDAAAAGAAAGALLAAHLRMTGRLIVLSPGQDTDRVRVLLRLSGGVRLAFADLRRFGSMHAFPGGLDGGICAWDFYANLGPEPLDMDAAEFIARVGRGRTMLKARLLDQTVVAGIGNIYADEALFRAGLPPHLPAGAAPPERLDALFHAVQAVLRQAIAENGSSIRDYRDAHGDAGAFQNHFRAYGRAGKPCTACGQPMQARRVAGRTSTFCPLCQPLRGV